MRSQVVKWLKPLNAVSVENPVCPGTPDVNYGGDGTEGWLELKSIDAWPANSTTALRIEHYSPQQRVWHVRRSRVGGNVYVLVKVASDWFLLEGMDAARELGKVPRARLEELALNWWDSSPKEGLLKFLKNISLRVRSSTCGEGVNTGDRQT